MTNGQCISHIVTIKIYSETSWCKSCIAMILSKLVISIFHVEWQKKRWTIISLCMTYAVSVAAVSCVCVRHKILSPTQVQNVLTCDVTLQSQDKYYDDEKFTRWYRVQSYSTYNVNVKLSFLGAQRFANLANFCSC